MIITSLSYISSLLLLCSVIVLISSKSKSKLFEYFPTIVIIYFVIVLLLACGFWNTKSTENIRNVDINNSYHLKSEINFIGIFLLIAVAFAATDIATILSSYLPATELISAKIWTILLVTLFGFLGVMKPIPKIRSDSIIASIFLYF